MTEEFDLFVHREGGGPRPVRASTGELVAEVLKRADAAPGPDALVFVGESEHARADDREEAGRPSCRVAAPRDDRHEKTAIKFVVAN
jgi:hypothetical protein